MYVYVCMCIYVYVCMYVCMYVCTYVHCVCILMLLSHGIMVIYDYERR
jgi:hypothetical protein